MLVVLAVLIALICFVALDSSRPDRDT